MMKNLNLVLVFVATILLVACTKDDVTTTASYEAYKAAQPTPIAFSTYMGEQATTRAGKTGAITDTEALQAEGVGFGVFAYYTKEKLYPNTVAASGSIAEALAPNFMYNQRVSFSNNEWGYSPLKYWPNDFNGTSPYNVDVRTGSDTPATGTNANYLSFFAYAPYVAVPGGASGITDMSNNSTTGDPTVTYTIAADNASVPTVASGENTGYVDLLWGVYNGTGDFNTTSPVVGTGNAGGVVRDVTHTMDGKATVNINLQKQTTEGHVGFAFKHALAKLGNITVQAQDDNNTLDAKTIITVESATISSTDLINEGTLNLATGVWTPGTTTCRLQGNESGYVLNINPSIKEPNSFTKAVYINNETHTWNTTQSDNCSVPGTVTTSAQNLVGIDDNNPYPYVLFIPQTQPTFTVTITYVVRTADPALNAGFTEVEQTISKSFQFGSAFEMNKIYNLAIHLGLTSVKFTATVSEWETANSNDAVNLPIIN